MASDILFSTVKNCFHNFSSIIIKPFATAGEMACIEISIMGKDARCRDWFSFAEMGSKVKYHLGECYFGSNSKVLPQLLPK